MFTLGIDLGSSSVKVSLLTVETGEIAASASYPENEMEIMAPQPGWAEQHPETWWKNTKMAIRQVLSKSIIPGNEIAAIGISYQMHGLVAVDKDFQPVRPSIIWCDSRAVETGNHIFAKAGEEKCMTCLVNAPGNFTLSKLAWVKENEPYIFEKIHKIMLPGDYLAMRLTGEIKTTASGLSEGIMWDFRNDSLAGFVLQAAGIDPNIVADIVPTFANQGFLSKSVAQVLGFRENIPVTYRAGDQPNNAFSLNVLNPGEIAATAGTSGVVYGVTGEIKSDPLSRVNSFAHVNYSAGLPRLGVLLCINGTGISNSWIKRITESTGYEMMNKKASTVEPGSGGLLFLPFGNGAERMLQNKYPGASFHNLDFNKHRDEHLFRAVQEGVVFAFKYGIDILTEIGMKPAKIRAGQANMFLSDVFCQSLSSVTNTTIELYNTDGAAGAARGAAYGAGFYKTFAECFTGLKQKSVTEPDPTVSDALLNAYFRWEKLLQTSMLNH